MRFVPSAISDVVRIEPDIHRDGRGFFVETYRADALRAAGIDATFVQDNHSRSTRGTLRGLHAQLAPPQGKLVRVVAGEVFDVAVDLRRASPTYLRWVSHRLSGETMHLLWIPPGFAHGFYVLSDTADVEYKCTSPYTPAGEVRIAWNDPRLAIPWPLAGDPVLSPADRDAPPYGTHADRPPR